MSDAIDKECRKIGKSIEKGELTIEDLKKAVSKKKRQNKRLAKLSKSSGRSGKSPKKKEPSNYLKFSNYYRKEFASHHPPRQVITELAKAWQKLDADDKEQWKKGYPPRERSQRSRSPKTSPRRSTKRSPERSGKTKKSNKGRRSSSE